MTVGILGLPQAREVEHLAAGGDFVHLEVVRCLLQKRREALQAGRPELGDAGLLCRQPLTRRVAPRLQAAQTSLGEE
eukprot:CAMPEP_0183598118 /NCGR_PEP_ID=MMETSP0371-20130417/178101_1 /TAXON_ID=268820 /ORGANISM="Peridinium aciculiferum, Strain PAER-2" /LENGTH=76 /DNA_ID=CAMNT_0025810137 /DNA_START=73 /DNA_END=300 /DNA_ORIENTATION=-